MSETGNECERCEGDGSYSEFAPCTTFGPDCACNGLRVIVDPCPVCGGSGIKPPSKIKLPDELRPLTDTELATIHDECEHWTCSRINGKCVGYHCVYCGEPCSMMGHDCERGRIVREAQR